MLNKFVWQNYLDLQKGKETVNTFRDLCEGEYSSEQLDKYNTTIKALHSFYCANQSAVDYSFNRLAFLFESIANDKIAIECVSILDLPEDQLTLKQIIKTLYSGIQKEHKCNEQAVFSCFCDLIEYYTTFLFIIAPDYFIPYYFQFNFNILEKIASEFDIDLPSMPIKKDYKGRFFYYSEICECLIRFREAHNMSPYELCAFLYDFAPQYIGGIDSYIVKELPPPRSAYFIGGSKDDIFLADEANTITSWQCSPDTQVDNMIVMYLRSPISAVDSIWRSVSIGFNDPFFYYYRCTYIANPVGISRITQKQLEQDEIFKNLPIVRKNMQGINGVELKPTEYNHLVEISNADVPKLQFDVIDNDYDFVNEKDVERKLIVPLIERLGYSPAEYQPKIQIMVGNHNFVLIPDYTILPKVTTGHHSAFAIIEAKHHIPNKKAMDETCAQARSYAVQLKAKYSVIASKDKLWVYKPDDDYTEAFFSSTWSDLNNPNTFSALFKMLGKKSK